jgi:hypothetical protein
MLKAISLAATGPSAVYFEYFFNFGKKMALHLVIVLGKFLFLSRLKQNGFEFNYKKIVNFILKSNILKLG